jgi:transcriptional regulator with XRE-family HTH domain
MGKKYTFAGYNNWTTMTNHTIHEGRNIKRFREMLGMKQEALASELGEDWNQKKISLLEAKETVEPGILQQVSKALKIPVEAIQNFDEEQAIHIISNTVNNSDNANGNSLFSYYPVINPIEKWMEALEEIKRLNGELLKVKDEQIKMLQSVIDKK